MSYFIYIRGRYTQDNDNEGCFISYWYQGDSLDNAIFQSIDHVQSIPEISLPTVESILFEEEDEKPPEEAVPTGNDNLWYFEEINTWDLSPDDHDFVFPPGIVPADIKGPFELEDIREGIIMKKMRNCIQLL